LGCVKYTKNISSNGINLSYPWFSNFSL
jgi:hypothetical protein